MKQIKGDLLEGDWDLACHVANNYCVMGSGIAYFLRKKWPEVFQADLDFHEQMIDDDCDAEPQDKLGKHSCAVLPDGRTVRNLYAMWGVGSDGHPLNRNCSYDALYNALYDVAIDLSQAAGPEDIFKVGIPKLMGCVRAGGAWTIVEAILQEIETLFPYMEFTIYELEDAEIKATSSVTI